MKKMLKCPFCGDYIEHDQSFRSHVGWKHRHVIEGDITRFTAPTYGLGSDNGAAWNQVAKEERERQR